MKILVVSSVYPRFPEDSEVPWLRRSVACLKEKGNEIKILAPAYKGLKSHTIDGIEVKRFRYATKDLEIFPSTKYIVEEKDILVALADNNKLNENGLL